MVFEENSKIFYDDFFVHCDSVSSFSFFGPRLVTNPPLEQKTPVAWLNGPWNNGILLKDYRSSLICPFIELYQD